MYCSLLGGINLNVFYVADFLWGLMELIVSRCIRITFPSRRMKVFDLPEFRRYLARSSLIHNHLEDDALRYARGSQRSKRSERGKAECGTRC